MMESIYRSPARVYLVLGILALAGILSAFKLPVSLFPNSTKPSIEVSVPYGDMNAEQFLTAYGRRLESQLEAISETDAEVEKVSSSFGEESASYVVDFRWGTAPVPAKRAVDTVVQAASVAFPQEVRDHIESWAHDETSFLAISFFSSTRSPDELFNLIDPLLSPKIAKVSDADNPVLFNPMKREVQIEINPSILASFQLFPKDIESAIGSGLAGFRGGSIASSRATRAIDIPRPIDSVRALSDFPIHTPAGKKVHLSDLASVRLGPAASQSRIYRTNGAASLFLYSSPKPGHNVKRMCEEILALVAETVSLLPSDIKYRVIIDPSEFIRASVANVFREVLFGSFLAVFVLYLFIGSARNTVTAAIEIPLSMVLAFILMKLTGMNLNIISLGGLALASGMNVDASVVVLDNILARLKSGGSIKNARTLITEAAREVSLPVVASTVASVVVFLPLAFTSDLTYAVLGDLAKTVVFSHAFSALIAIILVPTVRAHMASGKVETQRPAPLAGLLAKGEAIYIQRLTHFLNRRDLLTKTAGGLGLVLILLVVFVLPRLPRELIAVPDTDWVTVGMNTQGNTTVAQMDSMMGTIDARLWARFGSKLSYTFTRVNEPNEAWIMTRFRDRKDVRELRGALEKEFVDTNTEKFWVSPWNPSELPLPNPPLIRFAVRGQDPESRAETARELIASLEGGRIVSRVWSRPDVTPTEGIALKRSSAQWLALSMQEQLTAGDFASLVRVATEGKSIGELTQGSERFSIFLKFQGNTVPTPRELAAMPVGLAGRILPLKALADVEVGPRPAQVYREDGRDVVLVSGKNHSGEEYKDAESLRRVRELLTDRELKRKPAQSRGASIELEDAQKDLNEALRQLALAAALSIGLMWVTLYLQLGEAVSALLVLVSVPLGLIGVIFSLWIFRSTVSLNSALGFILLSGIAVANSIMLVDSLRHGISSGLAPREAALVAARKRLRAILITSCTTILGMLPIALGIGDGGRILQPLGIAVTGGLWVSTFFTLFLVPALHVAHLEAKAP